MSVLLFNFKTDFTIKKEHFPQVLSAIQALHGRETVHGGDEPHFMWLPSTDFPELDSVEDAFTLWRWIVEFDEAGHICDIAFCGEKAGNEDYLFEAVGPYVEAGSSICVVNDAGDIWRWYFDGRQCVRQAGQVTFD